MTGNLQNIAFELFEELRARSLTMSTAESCTGGTIAAAITSIAGSSEVFNGGIVAYSNNVKMHLLGVREDTLAKYGAVSEDVVRQMVCGACKATGSSCAVATSGIAGPGGGTSEKPVGTVWIAAAAGNRVEAELLKIKDEGRAHNICISAENALSLLLKIVRESPILGNS